MKKNINSFSYCISFFLLFALNACDNNEIIPDRTKNQLVGRGSFVFDSFAPLSNKPTNVHYYIPDSTNENSQILIVFHGGGRDPSQNRDRLIAKANQHGTIIVFPEFSEINFPGGDGYNLGNMFIDGDNPSSSSSINEDQWAFSLVEPIFDQIKRLTGNISSTYNVFGFSAGAQFTHRFLFFKPEARLNKAVAAASGWYTLLDDQIDFPYGIKKSPIETFDLSSLYSKSLTILIGESDNNPNAPGLRRNSFADAQGTDRLSRAKFFYEQSHQKALSSTYNFYWDYVSLPNVGHSFLLSVENAMDNIF